MRTQPFILLVLLVTLTGCVVTYRDFPNPTLESLPKDHEPKPLYYHVEPILTWYDSRHSESGEMTSRLSAGLYAVFSSFYALIPQIDPIGQPGYHEVARTLKASGMFSDMVEIPAAPDMGVYCFVSFGGRERSGWLDAHEAVLEYLAGIPFIQFFAVAGALALPYYSGEGGTTVVYSLYRDGQLQRMYSYPITKKGAGWIVLLPFAWLNFFTNDLKDAVHGTTLQFLIDAQRDGYL